jgi:ankyrin repeat protein
MFSFIKSRSGTAMEFEDFEYPKLDGFDVHGYSLLTCALHTRCISSVKLVLESGADVNQADSCGRLPIDLACGDNEACKLLIKHGLTFTQKVYEKMFNCMTDRDAERYIYEILDFDANRPFPDGKKPLEHAVRRGFLKTTECLLDKKKAVINAVDGQGRTVAHIAAELFAERGAPFYEIYSLLLNKGANVHLNDDRGNTPMILARNAVNAKLAVKYE